MGPSRLHCILLEIGNEPQFSTEEESIDGASHFDPNHRGLVRKYTSERKHVFPCQSKSEVDLLELQDNYHRHLTRGRFTKLTPRGTVDKLAAAKDRSKFLRSAYTRIPVNATNLKVKRLLLTQARAIAHLTWKDQEE